MPTVTVLMPIFNRPEYLRQAIDSVIVQTFPDWELWAMDDGSTLPGVWPIVQAYAEQDRRIVPCHFDTTVAERLASVRYSTLINWGVAHSESEYVTYLCNDDWYFPDRLERMLAKLHEGHDVVYGPQAYANADGTLLGTHRWAEEPMDRARSRIDLNSVMHTRESFVKAGGFPTEPDPMTWRQADGLFWDRLSDQGYIFIPVDDYESPTDAKRYGNRGVDLNVQEGLDPWA